MSSSPTPKRNLRPSPTKASAPVPPPQASKMTEGAPRAPTLLTGYAPSPLAPPTPPQPPPSSRKRKATAPSIEPEEMAPATEEHGGDAGSSGQPDTAISPVSKKSRTNTPWTPAEERRLKTLRDAGSSWNEIAKTFPMRTEGSVKKHWYKDMHYADFAEDESAALLAAIKDYEASKWKVVGAKVGKPAKACEQYAKEHFGGKV